MLTSKEIDYQVIVNSLKCEASDAFPDAVLHEHVSPNYCQ